MYQHPNLIDLPPETADGGSRFEASSSQTYQLLAVGVTFLAVGAGALWYWQQGQLQGRMGMLPFLLLPVGAVLTGLQAWNLLSPLRVTRTSNGFAVRGEECGWTDVAAVGEQLHPDSQLNPLTVWVRRTDGRTFHLSASRVADLPTLLATIYRETLPRLTEKARLEVDRGEVVRFGPIEFSATGLRVRGRVIYWDELGRVWPDGEGDLGVWASGDRKVLDVPTGKVDNVRVLLQLIEEYAPHAVAV